MRAALLALLLCLAAQSAGAACFADYKAKRDGPLRLHYGIVQLDDAQCADRAAAAAEIARRIAADGWQLLTLVDILTAAQAQARRNDADAYYLRY